MKTVIVNPDNHQTVSVDDVSKFKKFYGAHWKGSNSTKGMVIPGMSGYFGVYCPHLNDVAWWGLSPVIDRTNLADFMRSVVTRFPSVEFFEFDTFQDLANWLQIRG